MHGGPAQRGAGWHEANPRPRRHGSDWRRASGQSRCRSGRGQNERPRPTGRSEVKPATATRASNRHEAGEDSGRCCHAQSGAAPTTRTMAGGHSHSFSIMILLPSVSRSAGGRSHRPRVERRGLPEGKPPSPNLKPLAQFIAYQRRQAKRRRSGEDARQESGQDAPDSLLSQQAQRVGSQRRPLASGVPELYSQGGGHAAQRTTFASGAVRTRKFEPCEAAAQVPLSSLYRFIFSPRPAKANLPCTKQGRIRVAESNGNVSQTSPTISILNL